MIITRAALIAAAVALGVGWLMWLLAPVLTPFLAAALLAYITNPLVARLTRYMPRTLATTLVFVGLVLAFVLALLVAVPQLQQQLLALIKALPRFLDWLETTAVPWLAVRLDVPPETLSVAQARDWLQEHWSSAGQLAAKGLLHLASSGLSLAGALMTLLIIPVVTFYLLRDWPQLMATLRGLLPRRAEPLALRLAGEADAVLGGFLHGQLLVMLAQGTFYALGLTLLGLQQGLAIGFAAGLVTFVPYLGTVVGLGLAGVVAVIQFQDLPHLLAVLAVFGIGQLLESLLLTPLLVGDKVGLHPVAVIFAVLAGGQLFGFFGVLLALPAAAVLWVGLKELLARYRQSRFYATPGDGEGGEQA